MPVMMGRRIHGCQSGPTICWTSSKLKSGTVLSRMPDLLKYRWQAPTKFSLILHRTGQASHVTVPAAGPSSGQGACSGQTFMQALHSQQASATMAFFFTRAIAFWGQMETQAPHPLHFSCDIFICHPACSSLLQKILHRLCLSLGRRCISACPQLDLAVYHHH